MLYCVTIILSALLAAALVPAARKIALRAGVLSLPAKHRRHTSAMPMLGGAAIYIAASLSMLGMIGHNAALYSFVAIGGVFFAIGLADDMRPVKSLTKLIAQCAAAAGFVWFYQPFEGVYTPLLSLCAALWIVGIVNSMNFIDGLDMLCAGMVLAVSLVLAAMLHMLAAPLPVMLMLASVSGAALGFLPFNRPPARLFMGDAGSMFLGFCLGALSLQVMVSSAAVTLTLPFAVPLCFALPLADCALTVLRRLRLRRPLLESDWGHLHHRLLDLGLNHTEASTVLIAAQTVICVFAVAAYAMPAYAAYWIVAGIAACALYYALLRRKERLYAAQ